jgi:hypothetical protein
MKNVKSAIIFFSLFILLSCYSKLYSQSIAYLQKKGATQQLIVDRKPFLILAMDSRQANEWRPGPPGKAYKNSCRRMEYSKSKTVSI